VGGGQLKVATSSKRSSARNGFGTKYSAKALKLTAKVATRLNKKLRPKTPFTQGQILGTLTTVAQPQLVTVLEQNRASVVLDPAFAAKMDSSSSRSTRSSPPNIPAGRPSPSRSSSMGRSPQPERAYEIGAYSASSDPKARTISVSGAPLTLTAATAQSFNEAFAEGKAVFAAGDALGAISFVAQGQ
jgi:hypothetical protein